MQSTITIAPSVTLNAAVTSEEKSTCPGESIKLTIKLFPSACLGKSKSEDNSKNKVMPVDFIVIPLSCSSALVSVNLVSPAESMDIIPAEATKESVKVDFPWSTCATTDMFRILCFFCMISLIWSTVKFTILYT